MLSGTPADPRADLKTLAQTFSQVPETLISECAEFQRGHALVAGKVVHSPTFVQFDGRLSNEGGSDLKANWVS